MLNFKERHLAASCAVVLFAAAFAPVGSIADEAAVKARIERAKIELAKIKQGKKLSILDATKPEVVLPPLLILVDEELKEFGIDKEALAADIKPQRRSRTLAQTLPSSCPGTGKASRRRVRQRTPSKRARLQR